MYKIYNKALDEVYKKYDTKSLYKLKPEQIREVCKMLKISPKMRTNERGEVMGIDPHKSVDIIESVYTFSEYMGDTYWEEEHHKIAEEVGLRQALQEDTTGDKTFERMGRHQFGICNLKPGETQEVNWTQAFILEVFKNKPMHRHVDITDAKTNKKLKLPEGKGLIAEVKKKKAENVSDYKSMSWPELRSYAKDKGIDTVGKTKKQILNELE